MSYQVIARKYRPQRFAEVVGQEHVTQTLANAIRQQRIAHAYLFVGPRGTGKTTIARIFAKCLNCTGGPQVDFSEADPRCQEISEGRSLDVLEIDGASNRGIEEIRALRDTVKFAPSSSKFKIYIIDEVHMLTKEAFNALLKTLEEPPAHVKFMFATTEPDKVLTTILSRCQRFDLRRIPVRLIGKHLAYIAGEEKVQIEEAALHAIARGADGCLRDAESTLDQLISFCGQQIVEADVLSMFGLTARHQLNDLSQAILEGDVAAALSGLNDLAKSGKDLSRLVSDLLHHFRNLLLFQVSHGNRDLLEVAETDAACLAAQAGLAPLDALTRMLEVLTDCEGRLRDTASKKTLIEVAVLKTIQARTSVDLDAVLRQLNQLRSETGDAAAASRLPAIAARPAALAGPNRPDPPAVAKPMSVPAPSRAALPPAHETPSPAVAETMQETAAPPAVNQGDQLATLWSAAVEAVGRSSRFVRSYLAQAHPLSLDQNLLVIAFAADQADQLDLVDNAKNRAVIQTALKGLGAGDLQVKFVKLPPAAGPRATLPPPPAPEAVPAPAPKPKPKPAATSVAEAKVDLAPPKPPSLEDFKDDPLIKQALEIFKGQLVNVKT